MLFLGPRKGAEFNGLNGCLNKMFTILREDIIATAI